MGREWPVQSSDDGAGERRSLTKQNHPQITQINLRNLWIRQPKCSKTKMESSLE